MGARSVLLLVLCASCPKTPGQKLQPKEISTTEAIGDKEKSAVCSVDDAGSTLIVDIPEGDRAQIDDMMRDARVPIVGYDCKELRLKPTCKLESKFEYAWRDARERVIKIENKDAAEAQLPLASAGIQASIKAGRAVDIAIKIVGSKTTKFEVVTRPQLVGLSGSACEGASHFIWKVDVGAFAIEQRTSGEAKAAAQIFASGESASSKSSMQKEGKIDACDKAEEKDKSAPKDCGVPVRIYMRKIEEKAGASAVADATPEAPSTPPPPKTACKGRDECKSRCDEGHVDSCVSYAFRLGVGSGGPRDYDGGLAMLEKTCMAEEPKGCADFGIVVPTKRPFSPELAAKTMKLLERGCKQSDSRACRVLGDAYMGINVLVKPDFERGLYTYERACTLGNAVGCTFAATAYIEGRRSGKTEVIKKNPARGLELLEKSCNANDAFACSSLAEYLTNGNYMKRDLARAAIVFKQLCEKNKSPQGCADYALLQITGDGVAKNPEAARETLSKLCYDDNHATSCYGVGLLAELGVGGSAQNSDKALEQYVRFPMIRDASVRAVRLVESGRAKPDDKAVASIYARACTHVGSNDAATCKKAGALAEPSDKHGASIYYRRACLFEDKEACDKADALEPSLPPKKVGDGRAAPLTKVEKPEKPEKADAPPPPSQSCKADKDCRAGQSCTNGACARVDKPPPPSPKVEKPEKVDAPPPPKADKDKSSEKKN